MPAPRPTETAEPTKNGRSGSASESNEPLPPLLATLGSLSDEVNSARSGSDYSLASNRDSLTSEFRLSDPAVQQFAEGRDIYGEDEPPDEEEPSFSQALRDPDPAHSQPGRGAETRVAPSLSDVTEEDQEPSPEATHAGVQVKLEIVSGPSAGKVKNLRGVRMVIGRMAGCDWKLQDASASRRHCELVVGDKGVLIRDLGSGNGTRVNGTKIQERLLVHGDEITVGKTVLRFFDEAAAMRKLREEADARAKEQAALAKTKAQQPSSTDQAAEAAAQETKGGGGFRRFWTSRSAVEQVVLGSAGGLLLLLLAATGIFWHQDLQPPAVRMAQARLARAREFFQDGRYAAALYQAEEAEKLSPGLDKERIRERARNEVQSTAALEEARSLFSTGRLEEASQALLRARFGEGRGQKAKEALSKDVDSQLLALWQAKLEAAFASGDVASAEALLASKDAAARAPYQDRLTQLKKDAVAEVEQEKHRAERQRAEHKRKVRLEKKTVGDSSFESVAKKFHAGEYDRAALECDRVSVAARNKESVRARAQELKRLIPLFAQSYEDGHRKFKAGALDSSVRPLTKAHLLFQQIGFEGSLRQVLEEELASALLASAKASLDRDELAVAANRFAEAAQLDPENARAKEGQKKVEERAEQLYLRAYLLRSENPKDAASKLKKVMETIPEGQSLHEKAKELLSTLP